MSQGLPVSDVVQVDIVMTPVAAAVRNFGALLAMGASPVIDVEERLRQYSDLDGVANDFGTTAPEFLAADLFFAQFPQPSILYIGRWAQTATAGLLRGAILNPAQQALANFTTVAAGSMKIEIDGVEDSVTAVDLSDVLNLNGVASAVTAKLTGATMVWDAVNSRFIVTSSTTGVSSVVGFAMPNTTGTDISGLLGLTAAQTAVPVLGVAAETLLGAVQAASDISNDWYGLMLAVPTPAPAGQAAMDDSIMTVSAFIEAASPSRIFGVTSQNTAVLDGTVTSDIASLLKAANFKRTFTQYSSSSPYAVASLYGRAFTVDFTANNSTITLKFKQEPGVTAETLPTSQAAALKAKNCNVFVNYNNATAIVQEGVMANGFFFDEVHGTDWLQNDAQTAVFNLLFTSETKIPQTDPGINQISTTVSQSLDRGVNNGLIAPGVWNADGFGSIKRGQTLSTGYYIFTPPVATQSQADREARKATTLQCAIKLAGAVHFAGVIINVNR